MSSEGWARKNPLTPPLMNIEMNPSANSDAELIRNLEPYRLPSQIRTTMVDGMVITSVGKEKGDRRDWIHPADEHVMAVHHVAENGQSAHGINEHPVAEHGSPHVGDQNVGDDAHAGDDRDVDLGVSEEPEKMLPEQSRPTRVRQNLAVDYKIRWDEEAGAGDVIENEENTGGHENRERGQAHDGSDEPSPGAERKPHQRHAFTPHVERSGDEVQRAKQLADTENSNRSRPQNHAKTLSRATDRTHSAQRSILRPTTESGTVGDEECGDHHQEGDERNPERHHVEVRKGHVFRASLNGQEEVAEGRKGRSSEHKEDHDGSVHGHQLQVIFGRHHVAGSACAREQMQARNREISPAEVNTHEPGKEHSHDRGDQSQRVILLADHFVVNAEDVLPNEAGRSSVLRCVGRHIVHCVHLKPDVFLRRSNRTYR